MQRSDFLPLAIGSVLLLAGLMLAQASLIAMSTPLLLFSFLRATEAAGLNTPQVTVKRVLHKHRIVEGEALDVELSLSLCPTSKRSFVSVIDELPSAAELVEGRNQYLGALSPGETQTLAYRISLPRGQFEFPGARVTNWSRWGLASKRTTANDPTDVIVHPVISSLQPIRIRPRRTRGFAGTVRARLGGQGLDFFGCRSYVPGDDARRINWRAYARNDTLIVNEYELERVADVSIVLDARLRAHSQLDSDTTFDHSVRAAGSLAKLFLERGNVVGLLVYGDYLHWVFPGTGRVQQQKILDSLSKAYAAEKAVFEDLRKLPTRLFPVQSQIVLISPLVEEDDVEVVSLLVERGYSVILVCPHATTWEAGRLGTSTTAELALRMTSTQRSLFLDTLIRAGTRVVNWDIAEPIPVAIERDIGNPLVRSHR